MHFTPKIKRGEQLSCDNLQVCILALWFDPGPLSGRAGAGTHEVAGSLRITSALVQCVEFPGKMVLY